MNKTLIALCVLPLALLTTGCGNKVQKLCETDVTSGLLNPETAKFFDFEKTEVKLENGNSRYTMRVRAEGQLGNTITKTARCSVNQDKTECSCVMF